MALIPTERLAAWEAGVTVGVVGGIPLDRPVYDDDGNGLTAALLSIDNTGATDVTSAIYTQILAATSGTKVVLRSGTFQITGMPMRSNVTLAGQGPGVTILDVRGATGIAIDGDPSWTNVFNSISDVASGLTAGSTSIVVTDVSGGLTAFTAGRLAQISWPNDPAIPTTSVTGFEDVRSWYCMVTNVSGSTLTITPPIPSTYSNAAGAYIIETQLPAKAVNAGVESLTVDGTTGGIMTSGVYYSVGVNCWIYNVRITGQQNYGLQITQGCHYEVSKCWIEPYLIDPFASNHAGMICANASGNLVYDNIMESNFPGVEVNHSSAGSVFAYNLVLCNIFGLQTNHSPHNSFNLYEGNVVSTFISDGYFGSESDLTIFRNWVFGYAPADESELWTVALKRWTRNASVVCNILRAYTVQGTNNGLSLGQPNLGNSSYIGTVDTSMSEWWRDFTADTVDTPYFGEITTRTDADHGELTLSAGTAANLAASMRDSNIISVINGSLTYLMNQVGNVLTLDSTNGGTGQLDPLPALNSTGPVWAAVGGFQELDEQVEGTLVQKGNFQYNTGTIDYTTGADPIPDSLYLDVKPDWFYGLSWPPVDATTAGTGTESYSMIPAGYRYTHGGADPPSGSAVSFDGSGSTTFGGSGTVTFA